MCLLFSFPSFFPEAPPYTHIQSPENLWHDIKVEHVSASLPLSSSLGVFGT